MITALNAEGWKLAINDNGYGVKGEREVEHTMSGPRAHNCQVHAERNPGLSTGVNEPVNDVSVGG